MSKKECPSCAMEIDSDYTVCPICQYEFPVRFKINIKIVAVILIILFIYPLVKLLINLINQ